MNSIRKSVSWKHLLKGWKNRNINKWWPDDFTSRLVKNIQFCTSLCFKQTCPHYKTNNPKTSTQKISQLEYLQYLLNLFLSSIQVFPRKNSTFKSLFLNFISRNCQILINLKTGSKKSKVYPFDGLASLCDMIWFAFFPSTFLTSWLCPYLLGSSFYHSWRLKLVWVCLKNMIVQ